MNPIADCLSASDSCLDDNSWAEFCSQHIPDLHVGYVDKCVYLWVNACSLFSLLIFQSYHAAFYERNPKKQGRKESAVFFIVLRLS